AQGIARRRTMLGFHLVAHTAAERDTRRARGDSDRTSAAAHAPPRDDRGDESSSALLPPPPSHRREDVLPPATAAREPATLESSHALLAVIARLHESLDPTHVAEIALEFS